MSDMPIRIAFLCKRRYMGKDVIDDRYARLYEIPFQLARLGHVVHGYCLGYQGQAATVVAHGATPGELVWEAASLASVAAPAYPWKLLARLRAFAPHLVFGASDIPHVGLAAWLAKRLGVPYAVDLYDNFEGFGQARVPGFTTLLRRATAGASVVTTTSEALRELVVNDYHARGDVIAMPSSVDLAVFKPADRAASRRVLGLPENASLVGTAGGLYRDKGIDALYTAWQSISASRPDAHLVLAGPFDPAFPPPAGPRVHYLGQVAHARMALLFAALDVGVIYLRDTPFGRYCFPQKAYEMLACQLPVVAASVGAMTPLLAGIPEALYAPDDADDLARAVGAILLQPRLPDVSIDDWATLIGRIEPRLVALASARMR